ncbi:MAG: hypothetical protein DHS20C01_33580 [marine bacterium B5-7]|nr:MAG: hypothetical protein DHS20C01_33580 [marine bacterium B5-7]
MDREPLVFYHAGLGKVASTYLQKSVFPALENIHYIPRNRFRQHSRIIKAGEHDRYLISRECGKYLDRRLKEIHSQYPNAHILLFFRRHDQWIASHYRRYVKNGGHRPLDAYVDIDGDRGVWKRDQLCYMDMIARVEALFQKPPFVMTYDRLRADPDDFFLKLANHLGARLNKERLRTAPVHQSYSEPRLIRLRRINERLGLTDPEYNPGGSPETGAKRHTMHRLRRRMLLYRSYLLLIAAGFYKTRNDHADELTPGSAVESVREYYADDWAALQRYEASQFT